MHHQVDFPSGALNRKIHEIVHMTLVACRATGQRRNSAASAPLTPATTDERARCLTLLRSVPRNAASLTRQGGLELIFIEGYVIQETCPAKTTLSLVCRAR